MNHKLTPSRQKARKLLLEMFTISHGHNIIDSGCAYGYASDTNKRLGLDKLPFLLKQDWETGWKKGVHVSYLVNTLKYVEAFISGIHEPLQTTCDTQEQTFSGSYKLMNDFVEKLFPDMEVDAYSYGYTYNMGGICHLHNDIVYGIYFVKPFGASREGREAILGLQIHVGCDARWGFSYPGFFRMDGWDAPDAFITGLCDASIYCSKCEAVWDTDDGGYRWSGNLRGDRNVIPDLDEVFVTIGRIKHSGAIRLLRPTGRDTYREARCPVCYEGKLSVDVMVDY